MSNQKGVLAYVIRRLLILPPILLAATVLVFSMTQFFPGDPLDFLLPADLQTPEIRAYYHHLWGLDKPVHIQYFMWFSRLLRGDLGTSFLSNRPVLQELSVRYPNTLKLAIVAMLFAISIGTPLGIIAAIKQRTIWDHGSIAVSLFGISIPNFWMALILMIFFSVRLKWLPVAGTETPAHIVLPALSLGVVRLGSIARVTRSSMLEVLRDDYIRTARAKGLSERVVILKHALKNVLIPFITWTGLQFSYLLGGAVVVETIFSWNGIGYRLVQAIISHDMPLIQGCVLTLTFLFVIINLITDVAYAYVDPRIRY